MPFYPLLRKPEPQPSLDECWEPPPKFTQNYYREGEFGEVEEFQPGLNAQWKVDFCLCKRTGLHFPSILPHSTAQVRHSQLAIECRRFGSVKIPLVWISFIELAAENGKGPRGMEPCGRSRGRMVVRGRGIFRMVMFLSADHWGVLLAIRDWLRFLVVRQRIPHLVLGLEFDWAENGGKAKGRWGKGKIDKKVANLILIFKCKFGNC